MRKFQERELHVATLRQILTFELLGPVFQMKQSCPPSQNDAILSDIAFRMR